jgi:hypothetical protein
MPFDTRNPRTNTVDLGLGLAFPGRTHFNSVSRLCTFAFAFEDYSERSASRLLNSIRLRFDHVSFLQSGCAQL